LTVGVSRYQISASIRIIYSSHPPTWFCRGNGRPFMGTLAAAVTLGLSILATGCSLSLSRNTRGLLNGHQPSHQQLEDAYRCANRLRQDEQVAAAVYDYDKNPKWSPIRTPSRCSPQSNSMPASRFSMVSRLTPLSGPDHRQPVLQRSEYAAAGVGSNLESLSSTAATDLKSSVPTLRS